MTSEPVTRVWAWLRCHEDGSEELMWAPLLPGYPPAPLVAADEEELRRISGWAAHASISRGSQLVLVEFA